MLTPCFRNLTSEAYPINDFVVQNATDAKTSIQVLDEKGQVKGTYYWYNELVDGATTYEAGWFEFGGDTPANISLKPGEAVFFYTDEDGVSVSSSGQIPKEITYTISEYGMAGNGSPEAIDIDKIQVSGATDAKTSIQVFDSKGQVKGTYYWYNELVDGATTYEAGWFEFGGDTPAGIQFEPGDAGLFYTDETGVKATVPSAL